MDLILMVKDGSFQVAGSRTEKGLREGGSDRWGLSWGQEEEVLFVGRSVHVDIWYTLG